MKRWLNKFRNNARVYKSRYFKKRSIEINQSKKLEEGRQAWQSPRIGSRRCYGERWQPTTSTLSQPHLPFIRRRRSIELARHAVHDVRRRPRRVDGRQLCREQRRSVVVQRVWRGEPQRAVQRHGARPGGAVDPMAWIELLTQVVRRAIFLKTN